MIVERVVHSAVRELLMSGRPFQYAHLIKFERPSRPDALTGVVSTSAHRYTYLTDASRDVTFNDLSKDHLGNSNGSQLYIANKVLNVSNVQEDTEAKANNFTITLDGNGIGAAITASVTITAVGDGIHWDIAFPTDITTRGFREGDKIRTTGVTTGDYNIVNFRANNIVRIKKLVDDVTTGSGSLTATLHSEEIKSILLNKNDADYASFINREVYIYRAYFENGKLVGETPENDITGPLLLFKGIISGVSFDEDDNSIKIQWSLTSHWGDFAQVKGRITSDEFHRALDANGMPQPSSAIKPIYAYDKGFMHSESSINLLATYYVKVERQKIKTKSGFLGLGIGSKVKVKKYFVKEPRHSELDFQLQAKSIPLIYGVRNVPGIPIFADTLASDSSTVYMAFAMSEGEINSIYDIYINGKSLICANEADLAARATQTAEQTIDVVCSGRADRGDVLTGSVSVNTSSTQNFYDTPQVSGTGWLGGFFTAIVQNYDSYQTPTSFSANADAAGITHGKSIRLNTPQEIIIDFFSGRENQQAASSLVSVAKANGFKIQNDFWQKRESEEYWSPNHRLLDTAYVVVKVQIKEGETTIPDIEFIIKGKTVDCYNYDYSYTHDDSITGQNPDLFNLGQTVQLFTVPGNVSMGNRQIIDKWSFFRPDGVKETRFIFDTPPALNYNNDGVPSITSFRMTDGTNSWNMITFNHELHSGTITEELSTPVTNISDSGGNVVVTTPTTPTLPVGGSPYVGSPYYSVYDGSNISYNNTIFTSDTPTSTSLVTNLSYDRFRSTYL